MVVIDQVKIQCPEVWLKVTFFFSIFNLQFILKLHIKQVQAVYLYSNKAKRMEVKTSPSYFFNIVIYHSTLLYWLINLIPEFISLVKSLSGNIGNGPVAEEIWPRNCN